MKRLNALVLGAMLFASLGPYFLTAHASTALPEAKQAISAPPQPAAKAEAVTPQVASPVPAAPEAPSAAQAEAVLSEAPTVPDLSLFGKILAWVVAVNLLLGGAAAALAKVKDITATKADDNIYEWLSKIAGFLTKILDFATANTRPKKEDPK